MVQCESCIMVWMSYRFISEFFFMMIPGNIVLYLWTASDLKQICCSSTVHCNIDEKEKINNHANVTIHSLIYICGHRCWALPLTIHVMLRDVRWNIMQTSQYFPLARSSDLHPTKPLTIRLHFDQEMIYYKEFFKEKRENVNETVT